MAKKKGGAKKAGGAKKKAAKGREEEIGPEEAEEDRRRYLQLTFAPLRAGSSVRRLAPPLAVQSDAKCHCYS